MITAQQPQQPPAVLPEGAELINDTRQLEILISGVTDYAIYMLDPDGIIVSWNPGGERIKGYSAAEVIGRHFSMFYTPQDVEAGVPIQALAAARGAGRFESEGWRVRKDGTKFWAHVVIDAIQKDGAFLGFAKITRDITDRKEAQRALAEAQAALLESQKLEAVGQLTYGLAHDFNNLLTVIAHSVERVKSLAEGDDRFDRALGTARRALDRGTRLTKQLLAFSRGQALRPKTIVVDNLLRDADILLSKVCNDRITLSYDLRCSGAALQVDPAQLEAALLNLIINARHAIEPNAGTICIATRCSAEQITISVSDDGVGMAPDIAKRATEPFFTTKEVGRGTGLGLSQVYGFVQQTGGTFELQSTLGVGTNVLMHFPLVQQKEQPKPTVLFVDDDENILDVVSDSLVDAGYNLKLASNAKEALEIIERGEYIDVVFSDVSMPGGLSGIDLANKIHEARPDLRVILSSGYSPNWLPELPDNCEFLPKPYELSDLDRLLKRPSRRRQ